MLCQNADSRRLTFNTNMLPAIFRQRTLYLVTSCCHLVSLLSLFYCLSYSFYAVLRARGFVRSSYISLLSQCQKNMLQGLTVLTWFHTICSLLPGHNTVLAPWGLCWALTLTNRQAMADTETRLGIYMQPNLNTCTHKDTATHPAEDTLLYMHLLCVRTCIHTNKGVPTQHIYTCR